MRCEKVCSLTGKNARHYKFTEVFFLLDWGFDFSSFEKPLTKPATLNSKEGSLVGAAVANPVGAAAANPAGTRLRA